MAALPLAAALAAAGSPELAEMVLRGSFSSADWLGSKWGARRTQLGAQLGLRLVARGLLTPASYCGSGEHERGGKRPKRILTTTRISGETCSAKSVGEEVVRRQPELERSSNGGGEGKLG